MLESAGPQEAGAADAVTSAAVNPPPAAVSSFAVPPADDVTTAVGTIVLLGALRSDQPGWAAALSPAEAVALAAAGTALGAARVALATRLD